MNCYESARRVAVELVKRGQKMAVAESCTGGLIARTATMIVGASKWFDVGFITYCDEAKVTTLGVQADTLRAHTAASQQVAKEMVAGVLTHSRATYALATTGVAGPTGGTENSPVGQAFVAIQQQGHEAKVYQLQITLDRHLLQNYVASFAYQFLWREILLSDF